MPAFFLYYNKNLNSSATIQTALLPSSNFKVNQHCTLYTRQKPYLLELPESHETLYVIGNFTFYKSFGHYKNQLLKKQVSDHFDYSTLFKHLNGLCIILIHNRTSNEINILTDRQGFYPLYYYRNTNTTIFGSELKFFKSVPDLQLNYNEASIFSYLENGHLMLNQSWFKEIKRTRPATKYVLALADNNLQHSYYWKWSDIIKSDEPFKIQLELYCRLFQEGIHELSLDKNNLGLSLSGGLDSRWIGHMASTQFNIEAFHFGMNGYESGLARRCADILSIPFRAYHIQTNDWLKNRLDGFWKMDGMLHLGHLHEGNLHSQMHSNYSHCFHGFYGGGIYATTYECNKKINSQIARAHFKYLNDDDEINDSYYNFENIDSYISDQKIRYQSAYSIYFLSHFCKMIIPFYNPAWLEYNYSIDDRQQLYQRFFLKALNHSLSKGLLQIPWQKTGLKPDQVELNALFLKFRLPAIKERLSGIMHRSRHFINYNLFDKEINFWLNEFKSDMANLNYSYNLNSREKKLRMLSLLLWMKMDAQNSADVI
jgi:hypothetical protein